MNENYPITPPPELLKQWEDDWFDERENVDVLLLQAFQAGADQELEACLRLVEIDAGEDAYNFARYIRAARRPKPPSWRVAMCNKSQGFYGLNGTLSPAAQAVLDAFENASDGEYVEGVWVVNERTMLSAALQAVAEQVVPPAVMLEYYERNESPVLGKALEIRGKLLAIAAELEGFN
jgi:hypothetical protein